LTAMKSPVIFAVTTPSTFSSPEALTFSPSIFVAQALIRHCLSMRDGLRNLTVYSEVTVPGANDNPLDLIRA